METKTPNRPRCASMCQNNNTNTVNVFADNIQPSHTQKVHKSSKMSFADSYPAKDNMHTGYAGNLTPQQQAAFAEFMAKIETSTFLSDLKKQAHPDWFALRFLRATMKDKSGQRVFQPVAAEKRFLATMQWRRDQNIDLVRTNLTNNTLPKHVSTYLAEVRPRLEWVCPRTGRPITLEKLGKFTQHVKTDCFTEEQWIECVTYDLERHLILFDALSEAKGWEIGTNIFIMDVAGGGMGIVMFT